MEQNAKGVEYAVCYFDDGIFKMRTFGKTTRTEEEIKKNEVNFNKLLGINDYTMANGDFQDPFITCTWVGDDKIYVNFFHNHTKTHYHFLWHVRERRVIGVKPEEGDANGGQNDLPVMVTLECSIKNFPYKCFYNAEKGQIYSFYR